MKRFIARRMTCALAVGIALLAGVEGRGAAPVNSVDYPDKVSVGLAREGRISLDGAWQFQTDPQDIGQREGWEAGGKITQRSVQVPLPWELADEELLHYYGVAWYERSVQAPAEFAGRRLTLGFEGVGHQATVYVNGKRAGEHVGLQAPFLLDVTALLKPGETNTITLRVVDPLSGTSIYMDTHSLLKVSGLWRGVWLEATGVSFISDLFMIPDIDKGRATARVTICQPPADKPGEWQLKLKVTGPDGRTFDKEVEVVYPAFDLSSTTPTFQTADVAIEIPEAQLWDTENPHLYRVEAELATREGEVLDAVADRFGMRKIEARGGRFYLNNKVFYMVGAGIDPLPYGGSGDVNWFLPGPYAYPSDEETAEDIRKIKGLGVNFVRIPLRPMHPQWLRLADEMGLMVWQEASWTRFSDLEGWRNTWSECLLRDRNHPSAVLWTLFNESWGIEFVDPIYKHVKGLDPTRLVLDNTGGTWLGYGNYPGNHKQTDVEDIHAYTGLNHFPRAYWLGLRRVDPNKPLIASEFGPIPYMFNVGKFRERWGGNDPWWVSSGRASAPDRMTDALPPVWNHIGYEQRYTDWGMAAIYGNWASFMEAHDWYYYWGLKSQTQWMRMNDELSGYIAWIWDNAQHGTGAIDNFKDVKVFGEALGKIWTQDLLIVDETRHNYWAGEQVNAHLYFSHYDEDSLRTGAGTAEWWLEEAEGIKGSFACLNVPAGHSQIVGQIQFAAPEVKAAQRMQIRVRLRDAQGTVLSENAEPIWVYPRSLNHASPTTITLMGSNAATTMNLYGYKLAGLETGPKVVVCAGWNAEIESYVREGGTAICLMTGANELLTRNAVEIYPPRLGGHTDCFYARKWTGVFDDIPYENPYIWQFERIWPLAGFKGINPADHGDILAGGYMNLLNSQVATMMQYRLGKGRVIIMGHDPMSVLHEDPAALVLMNALIDYAGSDFAPKAELR